MARKNARLKSPPEPQFGLIAGSPPCPFAGSSYAIQNTSSKRKPCCVPIPTFLLNKSSNGFRGAGKSRSLSMKSELTSASRPKDSGRTYPSSALHRPCSVCSPSSPCSPTCMPRNKSCLSNKQPGMLRNCQPFRTHSPSSSKLWHRKSIFELHQFTVKYENHRHLAQNTAPLP